MTLSVHRNELAEYLQAGLSIWAGRDVVVVGVSGLAAELALALTGVGARIRAHIRDGRLRTRPLSAPELPEDTGPDSPEVAGAALLLCTPDSERIADAWPEAALHQMLVMALASRCIAWIDGVAAVGRPTRTDLESLQHLMDLLRRQPARLLVPSDFAAMRVMLDLVAAAASLLVDEDGTEWALSCWESFSLNVGNPVALADIAHWYQKRAGAQSQEPRTWYAFTTLKPGIGHLCMLAIFIQAQRLGWVPPGPVLAAIPTDHIASLPLVRCLGDAVEIVPPESIDPKTLVPGFNMVPSGAFWMLQNRAVYSARAMGKIVRAWEAAGKAPLQRLTAEQVQRGESFLRRCGIGPEDWHVCLHVREAGFHSEGPLTPSNCNIHSYAEAIAEVAARGGWVIRMGDGSMTPLPPMDRVIDYAHHPERSPELDLFLAARCQFLIGTSSGLALVATVFGRPVLYTNLHPPSAGGYSRRDRFMIKTVHDRAGAIVPLQRLMETHCAFEYNITSNIGFHGFVVQDNGAADLRDAVIDILNGLRRSSTEELAVLRAAWSQCLDWHPLAFESCGDVVDSFLRRYGPALLA